MEGATKGSCNTEFGKPFLLHLAYQEMLNNIESAILKYKDAVRKINGDVTEHPDGIILPETKNKNI